MGILTRKTLGLIPLRSVILVALLFSPVFIYALCGAVAIWQVGWMRWLWWLAPLIWSITWVVSKLWAAKPDNDDAVLLSEHWTPRDRAASKVVRQHQLQAEKFSADQLSDPQFYFAQAISLANDLAKHYRVDSRDPVSDRTVPEILATCRLVADDLERLVLDSVPGSRLLTVNQWKKLGGAPKIVRELSKGFWATSVLLNPLSLASWGTSKVTNEKVTTNLQTELLVKLYMMFIRQLGFYLIEMNSGRLRAGADVYRSQFDRDRQSLAWYQKESNQTFEVNKGAEISTILSDNRNLSPATPTSPEIQNYPSIVTDNSSSSGQIILPKPDVKPAADNHCLNVRLAVLGQQQVGKSSLIIGLTGAADLPRTKAKYGGKLKPTSYRRCYQLDVADSPHCIELIDTPGYQHAETFKHVKREIRKAIQQAHAILMVIEPGRLDIDLDFSMLKLIRQKIENQPNLKPPPVVVIVLTHGSDDDHPIEALQSEWGNLVDDWIALPAETESSSVSADEDDSHGVRPSTNWQEKVRQQVLPIVHKHLDTARATAMLIAYEDLLNRSKYLTLFKQARSSSGKIWSAWFDKS